uniref:GNAT family N-acetyltransferase n=1 Tax=Neobacillus citreus TaxID=2833578 RepID=A0A942SZN8_9BACI
MDDARFTDDPADIDPAVVHAWLTERSYWARGRTLATQEAAMAGSRCYGVVGADGRLLAFARVVTDGVTFGWLADVFVDPAVRGHGVGKVLVQGVVADLAPLGLKRIALSTADAHGLYEQVGFRALPDPEHWMVLPGPGFGADVHDDRD